MEKVVEKVIKKDIQIGYTTIKDFNIVGIDSYEEDSKGLTVNYKDGSSVKINGSTSAIEVLKIICETSIQNQLFGLQDFAEGMVALNKARKEAFEDTCLSKRKRA
jgi:hypothetical protein